MKYLDSILIFSLLTLVVNTYISASTLGQGGIYYTAPAMRDVCYEVFPEYTTQTTSEYEKWAYEVESDLNKVRDTEHYYQYLEGVKNMVRYALHNKEISMNQFKYKCLNMYSVLTKESNN